MSEANTERQYKSTLRKIAIYNKAIPFKLSQWEKEKASAEDRLKFIQQHEGESESSNINLQKGEQLLGEVPAGLIEDRAGESKYVGSRSGISFPIGSIGGRSIRYSVGGSRGHIERGAPVETEIDRGIFAITNKRLIFIGSKQTRESDFSKIASLNFPYLNRVVVSVSNRQKALILNVDGTKAEVIRLLLLIANADAHGSRDKLIQDALQELDQIDEEKPKVIQAPTFQEFQKNGFEVPGDIKTASTQVDNLIFWAISIAAFFTTLIPILQAPASVTALYFGWRVYRQKPAKRKALYLLACLDFLLLIASISNLAAGQIFFTSSSD